MFQGIMHSRRNSVKEKRQRSILLAYSKTYKKLCTLSLQLTLQGKEKDEITVETIMKHSGEPQGVPLL